MLILSLGIVNIQSNQTRSSITSQRIKNINKDKIMKLIEMLKLKNKIAAIKLSNITTEYLLGK